jgi:tetratricopeptide (TPR) repeat protein
MKYLLLLLFSAISLDAQSYERAVLFKDFGLDDDAKRDLIQIVTSKADDATAAKSYYLLGVIAFEEKKVGRALDTWRLLVEKFPDSDEAKSVKDRIKELAQIVGETKRESIDNAVAESYLGSADFWSRGKEHVFNIDSSWIDQIEASLKWYDRVIEEFPKSVGARIAYEEKLRTILGWEEPGQDGAKYGMRESPEKYLPILLKTFASYETDFPESASLQAFRFQIAQEYWRQKDWPNTRKWLSEVIDKSNGSDTFYKDLAERRLKKVEY